MEALHFAGSFFSVAGDDLSPELRAALIDCAAPGDASESVAFVRSQFAISGDKSACRAFLRGYGAWNDDELSEHEKNLNRLVWLAGCDLSEQGEIYFDQS